STAVQQAVHAAKALRRTGISAEVIDLRTIWPWDNELVLASAARTKRVVVAHESVREAGFGAEGAATVAEVLHGELAAPVRRLAAPRLPVGYAVPLEEVCRVKAARIAAAVAAMLDVEIDRETLDTDPVGSIADAY